MVSLIVEYPILAVACAAIIGSWVGFAAAAILAVGADADRRAGYRE